MYLPLQRQFGRYGENFMKKVLVAFFVLAMLFAACGCCAKEAEKLPVSVLIVPHFEIGEMKGDDAGEAQMFFEEYLDNCDVYSAADGTEIYYNPKNKVAMYLTGVGKTCAAMSTAAVLSDDRFDYANTWLLAVGCSGGAIEYATLGDVILESAVCDYDLGHTADIREMEGPDSRNLWFASSEYDEIGCRKLNPDTVARAYALTKDIRLKTTDISRGMLARNFPGEAWAMRDPAVIEGTSITSDDYWKGKYNHDKAVQVTEYYKCPDPYASTEMEDKAIVYVADRFGMLARTLLMRVVVNIDVFFDNATPESLWGENAGFLDEVSDHNEETLDIFVPGMENIFCVGKTIIDSILNGEF